MISSGATAGGLSLVTSRRTAGALVLFHLLGCNTKRASSHRKLCAKSEDTVHSQYRKKQPEPRKQAVHLGPEVTLKYKVGNMQALHYAVSCIQLHALEASCACVCRRPFVYHRTSVTTLLVRGSPHTERSSGGRVRHSSMRSGTYSNPDALSGILRATLRLASR